MNVICFVLRSFGVAATCCVGDIYTTIYRCRLRGVAAISGFLGVYATVSKKQWRKYRAVEMFTQLITETSCGNILLGRYLRN